MKDLNLYLPPTDNQLFPKLQKNSLCMLRSSLLLIFLYGIFMPDSARAANYLLVREQVDCWLSKLGDDGKFNASKGIDWGIIPGPFYTPEKGFGLGAVVGGMYRPDDSSSATEDSTISLSSYLSSTGAFGLGIENYSFFADDSLRFFLAGTLNNTPTWYWGKGYSAGRDGENKQKYTSQELSGRPDFLYRIFPHTYVGLGWSFSSLHATKIDNATQGPLLKEAEGSSVLSSGVGFSFNYDTRDFVPNPHSGQMASIRYTRYTPNLGSDTQFDEYELRYSTYHSLDDKNIIAWEIDGHFTQGDVPWNMLPNLGNSHRMRGYYEGRYRDRNAISSQLEYRRQLNWRHGIVAWVGGGTMGPQFSELIQQHWLPSAGIGYRFEFKPRMNVRLDYGVGKDSSGFYFQVGEAF